MLADKPHRLNGRTSVQRVYALTILPPVTALTVGLPAQRAIAQRFRAMARNGPERLVWRCPLIGVERKSRADGQNGAPEGNIGRAGWIRLERSKPFQEGLRLTELDLAVG